MPEPHICKPPKPWKGLGILGIPRYERGELWDCECGQQYLFDRKHIRSSSSLHVAGTQFWPWVSTWPYRYEPLPDGTFLRKQISFWPGYKPTEADLAGKVVTSWA